MVDLMVKNLDIDVSRAFAAQARREGKTSEELAREVITHHVRMSREELSQRLNAIRHATVGKNVIDPVEIIREDRDRDDAG